MIFKRWRPPLSPPTACVDVSLLRRQAFTSSPREALNLVSVRAIHMLISTLSVAIIAAEAKLLSTPSSPLKRSICFPMGVFFVISSAVVGNIVALPALGFQAEPPSAVG